MKNLCLKYKTFILIPLAIMVIGAIIGRSLFVYFKNWAWIGVVLFYWSSISVLLYSDYAKTGKKPISYFTGFKWNTLSIVLSLFVALIPLPIFLLYHNLINTNYLTFFWLLIALINPFFEEIFWRGYMNDKFSKIPFWSKTIIIAILFAASHPFLWGMLSPAMSSIELIISLIIMSIIWSISYKKSKSLVLPYFSHLFVDLFNCSILVFLNLLPLHHW